MLLLSGLDVMNLGIPVFSMSQMKSACEEFIMTIKRFHEKRENISSKVVMSQVRKKDIFCFSSL